MRCIFVFLGVIWAGSASAHVGHLAGAAGHDHWAAGAAIGIAIAIGIAGALKGKSKEKAEQEPEQEISEEEVPA